jgi:MinD-like ATPase involved in chromosome partitioning or flagellar assembly
VPDERVHLLLNKVERDVGIEVGEVQRYFPQGFAMVIPYGREVNRSLNLGQPVLADAPRCAVSKALAGGLAQLAPGKSPASGAAAELAPRRRFARREKVAA